MATVTPQGRTESPLPQKGANRMSETRPTPDTEPRPEADPTAPEPEQPDQPQQPGRERDQPDQDDDDDGPAQGQQT